MSDDESDLEAIDLGAAPTRETPVQTTAETTVPMPAPPAADTTWPPGWYSDPWTAGQYRYWTGTTWTGETNRWGPTNVGGGGNPWPPRSEPAASGYGLPTGAPSADVSTARTSRRGSVVAAIVALVLLVAASATVGYVIDSHSRSKRSADSTTPTTPGTSSPGAGTTTPGSTAQSSDPDRNVLNGLVVQQSDVGSRRVVQPITNGRVTSQPTLDLCNGTFPSERLRSARLQVATYDAAGNSTLSTEAVLYKNPAAAAQALAELARVKASCPHKPVTSPVGEGTSQTDFKAAPDKSWPRTKGVDRQAYSMVTKSNGRSYPSIAVYLRRGRVLLGLYFLKPNGVQPPVAGESTIAGIVSVFEARVARVAPAVVNRRG